MFSGSSSGGLQLADDDYYTVQQKTESEIKVPYRSSLKVLLCKIFKAC